MKRLLIAILLAKSSLLAAQCPPSNVNLFGQWDIDFFAAQYPNCETINGDLVIGDSTIGFIYPPTPPCYFTDLTPLKNLKTITGNLKIIGCPQITNLYGLHNLQFVQGIDFKYMINFDSLNVFENITNKIDLKLYYVGIKNLEALSNIPQFGKLHLTKLDSLQYLTKNSNSPLKVVDLEIGGTPLAHDSIFQNIEVSYRCKLAGNQFTEITGLNNTSENLHQLILAEPNLQYFNGFNNVKTIDFIYLGFGDYATIEGFNQVKEIDYFTISTCNFASVGGFGQLKKVNNNLLIKECQDLDGLSALSSIDTIGGNFTMENNLYYKDLDCFSSLEYVGGNFSLFYNSVNAVSNLDNLKEIEGCLSIKTEWINKLDFFAGIDSIGGLEIDNNYALTSLNGLENTTLTKNKLLIKNNAMLTQCAINMVCNALPLAEGNQIHQNWQGCNNETEVKIDCLNIDTKHENPIQNVLSVTIHPNPTTNYFEVATENTKDILSLKVLDVNGQTMLQQTKPLGYRFKTSNWPSGMYYLTITTTNGKKLYSTKLLKR